MMGWFYALVMGAITQKIYERRKPEETVLYQALASHLNTFLAHLAAECKAIPKHVEKELWAFLECGVLA
ncbi:MAG: hypothetical protein KA436_12895 [Oligoflexales bacterium]|nr:hypothetical protein [Oligoflexales bacterium]